MRIFYLMVRLSGWLCKMGRTTNKDQFTAIISAMKLNADIVKNNAKRQPEDIRDFWNSLKDRLNILGPPMKEVAEWKKVWSDYKSHLKKKLSHNKQEQRATGGGPNKMHKFSEEEDEVIALVGLKEAVEGIPNVQVFGCPQTVPKTEANQKDTLKRRQNAEVNILELDENDHYVEDLENVPKRTKKQMTPYELSIAQYELIKSQIEIQQNLSNAIQKALQSSEENAKNIQYNTRRIYKVLDEIKVQSSEHNIKMQEIAVNKLILKEQLLQLELQHKLDNP